MARSSEGTHKAAHLPDLFAKCGDACAGEQARLLPDNVAHDRSRGLDFTLSASTVMALVLADPTSLAARE